MVVHSIGIAALSSLHSWLFSTEYRFSQKTSLASYIIERQALPLSWLSAHCRLDHRRLSPSPASLLGSMASLSSASEETSLLTLLAGGCAFAAAAGLLGWLVG